MIQLKPERRAKVGIFQNGDPRLRDWIYLSGLGCAVVGGVRYVPPNLYATTLTVHTSEVHSSIRAFPTDHVFVQTLGRLDADRDAFHIVVWIRHRGSFPILHEERDHFLSFLWVPAPVDEVLSFKRDDDVLHHLCSASFFAFSDGHYRHTSQYSDSL